MEQQIIIVSSYKDSCHFLLQEYFVTCSNSAHHCSTFLQVTHTDLQGGVTSATFILQSLLC